MKKMYQKSKRIQIYKIEHKLPLKPSHKDGKHQFFLWKTGFFATEMALVLSHIRGTLSKITPNSLMVCTIHRIWKQQLAVATYSTLQSSKVRSIKGIGKNISQLSLCINVSHLDISLFHMVSQEIVSPLKVSHSFVEDWVFGYRDGTGVVTHKGNSLEDHSKVSYGLHNP
jgi:hypothetical protein